MLQNDAAGGRQGGVTRLLQRIRRRKTRLLAFIKRRMAGQGLFYWVQHDTKPFKVDMSFSIALKRSFCHLASIVKNGP